ncbi:uncharacterized protein LOC133887886 [Phragmites australis]|uniref:uncharacterized protein LOC133887886 n=1 Tax=Phragmites australis TaxID=29695 RepID=UPI002D77FEA9|nr:uncharacterized protein LOC133887886 [Phragmites australis]
MQPRSRIHGRDPPPPPSGGGRYRRRSPPPHSPRHHRRPRDPQRRTPERPPPTPRRYEDNPLPDPRSRAHILLEAGRLAAHYLVAQGVLPEHLLQARESPNHNTGSCPEPPSPAGYERKRDDDDDPRWRRTGGGAGDWGHGKGDDDRQARRSGWDRRNHSFDGRRKYNDAGGGGDVHRGARRTRDYDEPKRPPMSRSYSHNDRRASSDSRLDRRRPSRSRSRSRSRTRTGSYYGGSRRDSDRDLDHTKVPLSAIIPAAGDDGDVHYGDVDEMPRQPRVPSSVVVSEVNGSAGQSMAIEDGEMENEIVGVDHAQDISEEEDAEFAHEDGGEMDVTQRQLSDVGVHPSESVEQTVHMQPQISNGEEEMEAGIAPMDACMIQPLAEKNGCSEVRDEMEAPQSEVETGVGDLNRDQPELPAWYRIFDLNVVETQQGCEMSKISGDSPADHVYDSVPDLVGQMNQQTNCGSSGIQGQDEHDRLLEDRHNFSNHDLNNVADKHAQYDASDIQGQYEQAGDNHLLEDGHDLNKYDLDNEVDEHAHDNHLLNNENILLNHGIAVRDLDDCHLSNEQMLLQQNADEQEHDSHQTENKQMLINQGTPVKVLDSHHVNDEQLLLSHGADERQDDNHRMEPEPTLLLMGVHDVDSHDLNSEQMLLNNGVNKQAADSCYLKNEQMLLDQAADQQARVHSMGNRRMIPVINLEDDYEEQSDTREFIESKSDILNKYMDSVLQEHTSSQDQQTSSFPDKTDIQAASSSAVTPILEICVLERVL